MAKQQQPTKTNGVEGLIKRYLAATRSTEEAIALDELATVLNNGARTALTPGLIQRLTRKFRNASTSIERGNRLEELARLADHTGNAALKWFVLEAAEASTNKADDYFRIAAIEHCLRRFDYPDRQYEQRLVDWILSRLDIPKSWPEEERIYAIDALRAWIDTPRVRDRVFVLVTDEAEADEFRSLALDCWVYCPRDKVPAKVIKLCQRYRGDDTTLGRAADYVLRTHGIKAPEAKPQAATDRRGSKPSRKSRMAPEQVS
jgi:hypothetical protein